MTMTNQIKAFGASTACALSLVALQAQDTSTLPRSQTLPNNPSIQTDHAPAVHSTLTDREVMKANKASGLIGMDVKNTQNEKLGEIKDLAVDLQSGKIGYAVLSVGGFLGIGDKYIAVPPSAFHFAPDQRTLVLDADKAKVENAPGFAKNEWPDLNQESTHSSYWMRTGNSAQGTTGATTFGAGSGQSSAASDDTIRNQPGATYNSSPNSTVATPSRADERAPGLGSHATFKGKITAVNPETRTVTVEGPSGIREFKLSDHASLALKENRNPHLTDFKVGYPVTVGYDQENGTFVARSLIRSDAPEVK